MPAATYVSVLTRAHLRERAPAVGRELAQAQLQVEPGKARLLSAQNAVRHAW